MAEFFTFDDVWLEMLIDIIPKSTAYAQVPHL
jgi:hypothetical protein